MLDVIACQSSLENKLPGENTLYCGMTSIHYDMWKLKIWKLFSWNFVETLKIEPKKWKPF